MYICIYMLKNKKMHLNHALKLHFLRVFEYNKYTFKTFGPFLWRTCNTRSLTPLPSTVLAGSNDSSSSEAKGGIMKKPRLVCWLGWNNGGMRNYIPIVDRHFGLFSLWVDQVFLLVVLKTIWHFVSIWVFLMFFDVVVVVVDVDQLMLFMMVLLLLLRSISGWSWHGHGDCGNLCDFQITTSPHSLFPSWNELLRSTSKKSVWKTFPKVTFVVVWIHIYTHIPVSVYPNFVLGSL